MNLNMFFTFYYFIFFFGYTLADHLCCPPGQLVISKKNVCWIPTTNETTQPVQLEGCHKVFRLNKKYYTIAEDQKLHLHFGEDLANIIDLYCLGYVTKMEDVALKNATEAAFLCADEDEEIIDEKILGYCMIISVLFLIPTALIYSALPELRDVQGKSIVNFCISLGIGQGILVILQLAEYSDMNLCAIRGFLTYFFIIAAFFWSNSISVQVLLSTRRPATLDYSWHEFRWYFLYSWGVPTLLTVCMAIVNYHPGTHQRPGIGLNHCWFFNKTQQWYYMYSVMSLLLAANIAIFIYISLMIWHQTFTSSHLKNLKYKCTMSLRLIILMGLPWVFEMVGSLLGKHIIWTIIDVFNCLQGLLIFLLLVILRRRVIKVMYKHGWLDLISGSVEKYLAVEDDEENVVQHTDVPLAIANKNIM